MQILLSQEACRSHLYHAATQITENAADAMAAIRMAKAQGAEAFAFAAAIELFNFMVGLVLRV